ncbi:MAG: hypothetical protein HQ534_05595 [Armatimonadetes bacterium]|nr:hypothetical protein [Armatimonadota bacterium]
MDKCPICLSPSNIITIHNPISIKCDCLRCGIFILTRNGETILTNQNYLVEYDNEKKVNISGWIRENQGSDIILDAEKINSLMTLKNLSVSEKADKILKYLAKQFPVAGSNMNYDFNKVGEILGVIKHQTFPESSNDPFMKMFNKNAPNLLPLISVGKIIDAREFNFIWEDYLINEKKYISSSNQPKITPVGWAYLESLRQPNPDSKKAFVAMWFDPEMEKIYDHSIKKAIEDAGYKPIQIGRKEHNNDINDEIIGEIRSCKFVVADFTGNRGGVYYEAGFAYGLNIPVIYTCKEGQLKKVHFDVNHRNIIDWENGDDLYKRLLNRINSTIT